jgi:hypothetical protein
LGIKPQSEIYNPKSNRLPGLFLASFTRPLKRTSLVALSKLAPRAALKRTLIRAQTSTPIDRQNSLNFSMWPRYDVNTDQLADSARGCCAGIGSRLHRTYVSTNENRYVSGADILFSQELNICGFDHGVSGFDGANETLRLDHSECF